MSTTSTISSTVRILVIGATGQQGSAVIEALKEKRLKNKNNEKIEIYGMTRDINSRKSKELQTQNVKMVQCDVVETDALLTVLDNVEPDRIFIVTVATLKPGGKEQEIKEGFSIVDALTKHCKKNTNNKPYVVFSSVGDAESLQDVPHFGSKFEIEKYLKKNSQNNTLYDYYIIRPVFFMENLKNRYHPAYGEFIGLIQPDVKLKMISTYDIGRVVAICLENPNEYKNGILELAADNVTMNEVAIIFSKVWNTNVRYQRASWFQIFFLIKCFVYGLVYMIRRFEEQGFCEESMMASKKLNLKLLSLEEWTKREFNKNDLYFKKKNNTWLYSIISIVFIAAGVGYYYFNKK